MSQSEPYKLSVGSSSDYEDLIAEIYFPGKLGIIISQERGEGEFDVSVHSFSVNAASDFDFCRNINEAKVPLSVLQSAIDDATKRLLGLQRAVAD